MKNTYSLSFSIPQNTPAANPQTTIFSIRETLITNITFYSDNTIPGQVGFYAKLASGQTLPDPAGTPDLWFYAVVNPIEVNVSAAQPGPYRLICLSLIRMNQPTQNYCYLRG